MTDDKLALLRKNLGRTVLLSLNARPGLMFAFEVVSIGSSSFKGRGLASDPTAFRKPVEYRFDEIEDVAAEVD